MIIATRTREIRQQNETLEQQKIEIEESNAELTEKNSEITSSIVYSRRIQHSLLPGNEKVRSLLRKSFILYRPKDIVSGDFYWTERSVIKPELVHFSVADCTGHGVPGAMVSLIGTRALNNSIFQHELTKAGEILDKTNDIVLEAFTDHESDEIIKDGMDIAFCGLDYTDPKNVLFQFAGAQNPVWIVRKEALPNIEINGVSLEPNLVEDGHKLFEIKGDKQPVGHFENRTPFTSHEGILQSGDRIYMTSDGFADQFGGDSGKKFKYKNLKLLILSVQSVPIEDQRDELNIAFLRWKEELEQVDDVCLMGVEV